MYSEALRIARQIGDRWLEGRVLNNLANVHHEAGRLEESRSLLEQAVAIYREIEDRPTMGLLLGNLASLLVVQGRMDEAAPLLKQALAIHREVGARRHEGHALGNLGTLLAEQRRLDEAREWFEQALRVYREVGARRYEGGTRTNLANLHKEQGRIEEARSQYEAALTILRRLGDQPYCASALRNLAMLERQCYGRLDEAERLVRESRALVPAQYALERLACLVELGHLELARGRSAGTRIEEIQAKAAELDVEAQSPLGQAIARLLRAQDEFTSGGPLFRGDRVEDLTEGLRRWLVETDQLPRAES
jgi:tetratricopeptide (TPR) repeat protein